jgi:hypothetical protein
MKKSPTSFIVIGTVLLALSLRLLGINHSFPFIFHPDEPTIVRSALGVRFASNPGHFDWPHLYVYLNYFVYMIFAYLRDLIVNVGYKDFVYKVLPIIWNEELIFYHLTRIVTAIFGALTVIPIYLTVKKLFGQTYGIIAGILLAVLPFHIRQSHYSLPDIPMLFYAAWSVYFAVCVSKVKDLKNYALAGFFAGLSASTKYNGAFSLLILPFAHLVRIWSQKTESTGEKEGLLTLSGIGKLFVAGLSLLLGFLLGTPYALLDYKTFIRTDGPIGALWQFRNVGHVDFAKQIQQFIESLSMKLPDDLGYTPIVLLTVSVIYVLVAILLRVIKKQKTASLNTLFMVLIPTLILLFYISGFKKTRSQYYLTLYPTLILCNIGMLKLVIEYLDKRKKQLVSGVFVVLFLVIPLYYGIKTTAAYLAGDTRNYLYSWLKSSATPTDVIYYKGSESVSVLQKTELKTIRTLRLPSTIAVFDEEQHTNGSNKKLTLILSNKNKLGPTIYIYKQP